MSVHNKTAPAFEAKVLKLLKEGVSGEQIARDLGIGATTVRRIRDRAAESGPVAAKKVPKATKAVATEAKVKAEREPSMYARAVMSERTKKVDWNATQEDCIADLRRVQTENPDRFIGRNFYRVNGKYSDSSWDQHFGTFAQFRRSAGLELSRSQSHLEKKIARHAHLDVYRKFFDVEVAPWVGKYEKVHDDGRIKTALFGSDFHDVEVDPFVLSVFLDTAKRVQPDLIILGGDVYDQYEFSHYDQDPRQVNIRKRYEFVRDEIMKPLRELCPTAQIDFIIGNHEQRILELLADRSPSMKVLVDLMGITFAQLLGLDEHRINLISKSDFSAYNAKEMHAEVKKNYKKYFGTFIAHHFGDEDYALSCVSGHTHKPKMLTKANEAMGPIWNLTCGSMCRIDAEYHQQKVNSQNSFAIIHVDTWEKQAVPEHILFTSKMAVVGGKFYFRPEQD